MLANLLIVSCLLRAATAATGQALRTFMLMKHEGAKCLEDVRHLHREPGLMKLFGFEEMPEARTLGNWLRRIGNNRQSLQALIEINKCMLSAGLHHCKRVTLDIDAAVIECNKRGTKFNCKGSTRLYADCGSPS